MNDFVLSEQIQEAWAAGRRLGLEQAAHIVEQIGGDFEFLISPSYTAKAIREMKGE